MRWICVLLLTATTAWADELPNVRTDFSDAGADTLAIERVNFRMAAMKFTINDIGRSFEAPIVPRLARQVAYSPALQAAVENAVRYEMRDPASATFRNLSFFTTSAGGTIVVCGELNGRNGFGGYTGFQPFLSMFLNPHFEQSDAHVSTSHAWVPRFCQDLANAAN